MGRLSLCSVLLCEVTGPGALVVPGPREHISTILSRVHEITTYLLLPLPLLIHSGLLAQAQHRILLLFDLRDLPHAQRRAMPNLCGTRKSVDIVR